MSPLVAAAHPVPPGYNPLTDESPLFATIDGWNPADLKDAFVLGVYGAIAHFELEGRIGHEIIVYGYEDEPYMKVAADGTTYENHNAPSYYINYSDTGGDSIPPAATGTAVPDWQTTGTNRKVSWHDHRLHWMQTTPPTTAAGSDVVQNWDLHLSIDGTTMHVTGAIRRDPNISWDKYKIAIAPQVGATGGGGTVPTSSSAPILFAVAGIVLIGFTAVAVASARTSQRRRRQRSP